jgi:hypothetical protein
MTFRSEISNPSFNSSPWMRGAPQVGFSLAMVWIAIRTSRAVNGLPTSLLRDRKRQYKRKPFRCQRTTVSGFTIRSDLDQFGHSRRRVNTRSKRRKRARWVRRFKTINCYLKVTISSPERRRERTKHLSQVNNAISQSMNQCLYQGERLYC